MRLPSPLIERKVDFNKVISAGFNLAVSDFKDTSSLSSLTAITAELVMGKSTYPAGSAQSFSFALGYCLGVLHKVAIISAKGEIK